ncbi:STN domain-containing protein [Rhodopseudomonas palustris]|nr:STN domain-containing protein [Rhodopseudomonas palustris]
MLAVILLSNSPARAADDPQKFDMPSRPLAEALVDFADRTGIAALIDSETARGKTSSAVRGTLTPANALRILLAGTGLSFRRVGEAGFAVGPNTREPDYVHQAGPRGGAGLEGYFARLQTVVVQSLCVNADLRATRYRSAVQVWIGQTGEIDAVHALGSAGDARHDAQIVDAIATVRAPPPPIGLPQPVTLLLQHITEDVTTCPP